jgi:hypothetical protein
MQQPMYRMLAGRIHRVPINGGFAYLNAVMDCIRESSLIHRARHRRISDEWIH